MFIFSGTDYDVFRSETLTFEALINMSICTVRTLNNLFVKINYLLLLQTPSGTAS